MTLRKRNGYEPRGPAEPGVQDIGRQLSKRVKNARTARYPAVIATVTRAMVEMVIVRRSSCSDVKSTKRGWRPAQMILPTAFSEIKMFSLIVFRCSVGRTGILLFEAVQSLTRTLLTSKIEERPRFPNVSISISYEPSHFGAVIRFIWESSCSRQRGPSVAAAA